MENKRDKIEKRVVQNFAEENTPGIEQFLRRHIQRPLIRRCELSQKI